VALDVLLELELPEAAVPADAVGAELACGDQPVDGALAHAEVHRHAALGQQRMDLRIVVDRELGEVRHARHTRAARRRLSDPTGPAPIAE
jgi:hypothetical protein